MEPPHAIDLVSVSVVSHAQTCAPPSHRMPRRDAIHASVCCLVDIDVHRVVVLTHACLVISRTGHLPRCTHSRHRHSMHRCNQRRKQHVTHHAHVAMEMLLWRCDAMRCDVMLFLPCAAAHACVVFVSRLHACFVCGASGDMWCVVCGVLCVACCVIALHVDVDVVSHTHV